MNYINTKNTTKLKKGSKILSLKECVGENSLKTYKTNSYLISVYKFYSINGFEPYTSLEAFIKDFENNNNECIIKTFMTVFDAFKECSKYPFFNNPNRYIYTCSEEQDKIEKIIEETYYQVFSKFKGTLDISKLHNLMSLKAYIEEGIKQKAHLDRHIKNFKRAKPYDTETIEYLANTYDMEDRYIKNESHSLTRTTIQHYIDTKDKIDKLIIIKNLMRHGLPYGETENHRFTFKYIACICKCNEKTVRLRNKKLTAELEVLCQNEILPLMIS